MNCVRVCLLNFAMVVKVRAFDRLARGGLPSSITWDVSVVQSLSRVQLFVTPWTAAHQASLFFSISRSLLKLMSIESAPPLVSLKTCKEVGKAFAAI